MANPLQHAAVGLCVSMITKKLGFKVSIPVFIASTVLPDVDFFLLVPLLGRVKGHRTITHAPFFQLVVALLLRPLGFLSIFMGMFLHSLIDNLTSGRPPGVAWFWPLTLKRFKIGRQGIQSQKVEKIVLTESCYESK